MRRDLPVCAAVGALFCAATAAAPPARSEAVVVEGYTQDGSFGHTYSSNYRERHEAGNDALRDCSRFAVRCIVLRRFSNTCFAMAYNDASTSYAFEFGVTVAEAERRALSRCAASSVGCHIVSSFCDGIDQQAVATERLAREEADRQRSLAEQQERERQVQVQSREAELQRQRAEEAERERRTAEARLARLQQAEQDRLSAEAAIRRAKSEREARLAAVLIRLPLFSLPLISFLIALPKLREALFFGRSLVPPLNLPAFEPVTLRLAGLTISIGKPHAGATAADASAPRALAPPRPGPASPAVTSGQLFAGMSLIRAFLPSDTAQSPRDPVAAAAALQLAHAYLSELDSEVFETLIEPTRAPEYLNTLSLAAKQITLAERADPAATVAVEDKDGTSHTFTLTMLKWQSLYYEGICRGAGDPKRAIRILEQAVALDPSVPTAYFALGIFHSSLLNKTAAIAALEKAAALDPGNLDYRKTLDRARNISASEVVFDRAAAGVRTTGRVLRWTGIGVACLILGSCVAGLADPETRGPMLGITVLGFIVFGLAVDTIKSLWNSITGRE